MARGLVANVWRVPILDDRPATWADAEQITFDEAYIEHIDVSPDGKRLVISSDHARNADIWILPVDGGDMRQLTTDPTPDWGPRFSPDGQQIVFYAYRSGNRDIWVMPANGGAAVQLTTHEGLDRFPAWSPDGREIAFASNRDGSTGLWVIPAEGGEARNVAPEGNMPDWSPDAQWLAFPNRRRVWRVPAAGGDPEPLAEGLSPSDESGRWAPDGTQVFFSRSDENGRNFWAVSVAGREERQLTSFEGRPGNPPVYAPATDGQYLYFTWEEDIGDKLGDGRRSRIEILFGRDLTQGRSKMVTPILSAAFSMRWSYVASSTS